MRAMPPERGRSMKHMIRYKLKPDRVAENERLSAAVYDALRRKQPPGLHYATFRQADGLSFVHVVSYDDGVSNDVLTSLPEFKAFSEGVKDRCIEPPVRTDLTEIGAYGFFGACSRCGGSRPDRPARQRPQAVSGTGRAGAARAASLLRAHDRVGRRRRRRRAGNARRRLLRAGTDEISAAPAAVALSDRAQPRDRP